MPRVQALFRPAPSRPLALALLLAVVPVGVSAASDPDLNIQLDGTAAPLQHQRLFHGSLHAETYAANNGVYLRGEGVGDFWSFGNAAGSAVLARVLHRRDHFIEIQGQLDSWSFGASPDQWARGGLAIHCGGNAVEAGVALEVSAQPTAQAILASTRMVVAGHTYYRPSSTIAAPASAGMQLRIRMENDIFMMYHRPNADAAWTHGWTLLTACRANPAWDGHLRVGVSVSTIHRNTGPATLVNMSRVAITTGPIDKSMGHWIDRQSLTSRPMRQYAGSESPQGGNAVTTLDGHDQTRFFTYFASQGIRGWGDHVRGWLRYDTAECYSVSAALFMTPWNGVEQSSIGLIRDDSMVRYTSVPGSSCTVQQRTQWAGATFGVCGSLATTHSMAGREWLVTVAAMGGKDITVAEVALFGRRMDEALCEDRWLVKSVDWIQATEEYVSSLARLGPFSHPAMLLDSTEDFSNRFQWPGSQGWASFDLKSCFNVTRLGIFAPHWDDHDKKTPREVTLLSADSLAGPWRPVVNVTVPSQAVLQAASLDFPSFHGFWDAGRYWRIQFHSNFGASYTEVREVNFGGHPSDYCPRLPSAATHVQAGPVNLTTAWMTWRAPKANRLPVLHYQVQARSSGSLTWAVQEHALTQLTDTSVAATVTGLSPRTSYELRVVPVNALGEGEASQSAPVSTPIGCLRGWVLVQANRTNPDSMTCWPCARISAVCDADGLTLHTVSLRYGFWRYSNATASVHACPADHGKLEGGADEFVCRGGTLGECSEGYTGIKCSLCAEGYAKSIQGACISCAETDYTLLWLAVGFVGVIVLVRLLLRLFRKRRRLVVTPVEAEAPSVRSRALTERQVSLGAKAMRALAMARREQESEDGEAVKSPTNAQNAAAAVAGGDKLQVMRVLVDSSGVRTSLAMKVKILVSFMQLASQMQSIFDFDYPEAVTALLERFDVANLDIVRLFSVACSVRTTYYYELVFMTLSPIVLCVLVAVLYKGLAHMLPDTPQGKARRQRLYAHSFTAFLFVLYLVYPSICSKISQMLIPCEGFENSEGGVERFMTADYRLSCDASLHRGMAAYAYSMFFLYPIGVIVLYTVLLFRARHFLYPDSSMSVEEVEHFRQLPEVKSRIMHLEFLFGSYEPRYYYFEVVDLVRKLLLTVVSLLLADIGSSSLSDDPEFTWQSSIQGSVSQCAFGLLVCAMAITVYGLAKPYQQESDDILNIISQWSLFFMLFSGLLIKVDSIRMEIYDVWGESAYTAVVVLINVSVVFLTVASVIYEVWQHFKAMSAAKRDEAEAKRAAKAAMSAATSPTASSPTEEVELMRKT